MIPYELDLFLLVLPMIAANVLHMLVVKWNWFPNLAKPIAAKAFGPNKTWRAFVVLPLASGFFCWLFYALFGPFGQLPFQMWLLGIGLGLFYLLFELPNSYLKRKLGIPPGGKSKKYPRLQLFIDKSDSIIGILIFFGLFFSLSLSHLFMLYLLSLGLHYTFSYLLFLLKIKKAV